MRRSRLRHLTSRQMNLLDLIYSFRARLLLVLAVLLVTTLGVQFYFNRRAEQRAARVIAEQEQALAGGVALALRSLSAGVYMKDLVRQVESPLLDAQQGRVINILVVNDVGRIDDSLDPRYLPRTLADNSTQYFNAAEVLKRIPLVNAGQSTDDIKELLRSSSALQQPVAGEPRAVPIRLETDKGFNYIVVVLGSADPTRGESAWQPVRPMLPTLLIWLIATLAAAVLVWRFTQPIKDISSAAGRVAAGDFNFHVPAASRRDEMGALAMTFNDMTARLEKTRELETRLNMVERSAVVGRLASAIAHEIRNPLNYINLTLDHLQTSLAPEHPQKRETFDRLATGVKSEVARINTRISEFLNYSRPSKLDLRPVDVRASVEDALRMVEVQAAESGVELRVEQAGEVPPVFADAEALRSIFTNLIINGLQATEGGTGKLTVSIRSEGDERVAVSFADTGAGIAPENVSQVFEPYFSTKETGTGLGLAIVKKAVDDHHGTIEVQSTQGSGTTFTVTLPTTDESQKEKGKGQNWEDGV